jgi:hypothetical protein
MADVIQVVTAVSNRDLPRDLGAGWPMRTPDTRGWGENLSEHIASGADPQELVLDHLDVVLGDERLATAGMIDVLLVATDQDPPRPEDTVTLAPVLAAVLRTRPHVREVTVVSVGCPPVVLGDVYEELRRLAPRPAPDVGRVFVLDGTGVCAVRAALAVWAVAHVDADVTQIHTNSTDRPVATALPGLVERGLVLELLRALLERGDEGVIDDLSEKLPPDIAELAAACAQQGIGVRGHGPTWRSTLDRGLGLRVDDMVRRSVTGDRVRTEDLTRLVGQLITERPIGGALDVVSAVGEVDLDTARAVLVGVENALDELGRQDPPEEGS